MRKYFLLGMLVGLPFTGVANLALADVTYAHPAAPCQMPEGTWKENCDAWHTLVRDEKGCTLTATCQQKDHFHTWALTSPTPTLHYCEEKLSVNSCPTT